ncbi:MAG: hypothetical protein ACREXW_13030 [Gammaproteobacteria bacterium]
MFGKDTATAGAFPANINLSTLDGTNGFRLSGVAAYDRSGVSVSAAGDVDGDGVDGRPGHPPQMAAERCQRHTVTNLASATATAVSLSCSLGTTPDQIEEYAAGASGLQNLGDGNYQLNWKTPKSYASSSKTLKLDLGEGPSQERTALFQFTK